MIWQSIVNGGQIGFSTNETLYQDAQLLEPVINIKISKLLIKNII